jgi:hypothetical protein
MKRLGIILMVCIGTGCLDKSGNTEPEIDPIIRTMALAAFSGCMTLDNWNTAQMGAWATKDVEGGVVCSSCHGQGGWFFDTNIDSTEMFNRNRLETFIGGFFTVDPETEEVISAVTKLEGKGAGTATHPTFATGQADAHFQYLEQFVQLTNAAKAAGTCEPAGFPPAL